MHDIDLYLYLNNYRTNKDVIWTNLPFVEILGAGAIIVDLSNSRLCGNDSFNIYSCRTNKIVN